MRKPVILKWDNDSRFYNSRILDPGALNSGEGAFENLLDITFERLREKQAEYTIRQITKMDELLSILEKELDGYVTLHTPGHKDLRHKTHRREGHDKNP